MEEFPNHNHVMPVYYFLPAGCWMWENHFISLWHWPWPWNCQGDETLPLKEKPPVRDAHPARGEKNKTHIGFCGSSHKLKSMCLWWTCVMGRGQGGGGSICVSVRAQVARLILLLLFKCLLLIQIDWRWSPLGERRLLQRKLPAVILSYQGNWYICLQLGLKKTLLFPFLRAGHN